MIIRSSRFGKRLFALLMLWSALCTAACGRDIPQPFHLTTDTGYTALPAACWQVLADHGGGLSFPDVLSATGFQDTDRTVHYDTRTYWIRFRLTNNMAASARIALPVRAAYADIYYARTAGGKWTHQQTGMLCRWSQRDGLRRVIAFTLTVAPGETVDVYLRQQWDFIAAQPEALEVFFTNTDKLIDQNYVSDERLFMTSIQDAFLMGLFVLTLIITFYYYLVTREREFLLFVFFALGCIMESLSSLNDVFLREYPSFLLYIYLISNIVNQYLLIQFLRYFLKTFVHYPSWDRFLNIFSYLVIASGIFSRFAPAAMQLNLADTTHVCVNVTKLITGIVILTTLALFIRKPGKAVRLMILALIPILTLEVLVYLLFVIYHMYTPRFGLPGPHGQLSFSRSAFFIMIVCYLWMMAVFNWVLFLRFSDIRKALEEHSTLDRLKSRFFANISHEFRTPLTLIMGPLEDYRTSGDDKALTGMVPAMQRNARRLLELINQLLDLSRLDRNHYRISTSRTDIIPFVKQLTHAFSSLAQRKDITLIVETDPALEQLLTSGSAHFYFDEDIVEKIVSNLLSNAFKFTEAGGSIGVRLRLAENQHHSLLIQVDDSGSGIPQDKLPYIFDRFYQIDDSMVRRFGGSGIGLSLVKELVTLHGGTIAAASEPGKGTTINCLLPLDHEIRTEMALPAKEDKLPPEPLLAGEEDAGVDEMQKTEGLCVVLIVEDQDDVRAYIREKLTGQYHITEARDGKEGLEKALTTIPDLLISDVMMPGLDGFTLCKKLKTDDRTCHIPVILLTARAEDADRIAGLETGADAYVVKPFNAQELLARIQGLIATRNRIRRKFSDRLIVRPEEITVTSRDQTFMTNLLAIIEKHIPDGHFSVEALAGEVHMSVSQINRKLKGLVNQSPQQLIRSLRMQRAMTLLKNDAGNIGEISFQVGYEDPGYFTKVFKNYFGCLPSERDKFPENPGGVPAPPKGE